MAMFFKKSIAGKVVSAVRNVVCNNCDDFKDMMSYVIKVNKERSNHPQLLLPVKSVSQSLLGIQNSYNPKDVLRTMRNQGLPSAEGIIDIELNASEPHENFVFTIDRHIFTKIVLMAICGNQDCFFHDIQKQAVLVVFNSPSIGSEFNLNDFRALIHSNFVTNICEFVGHKVTRINSLEDWGPKCGVLLAGYEAFGNKEELDSNASDHMFQVQNASLMRCETDETFRKKLSSKLKDIETADQNVLSLWTDLKNIWMKELNAIYRRLGIEFNETCCDSVLRPKISCISDDILQKELTNRDRSDEQCINTARQPLQSPVLHNIADSSVYTLARRIACAVNCKDHHHFDNMYYTVGKKTEEYYGSMPQILRNMGYNWHESLHPLTLREIQFEEKKIPKLSPVLDKLKMHILLELQYSSFSNLEGDVDELAENLSVAALIVNVLKHKRNKNCIFSLDEVLQFGEHTGVYFQFCHADLHERLGDSGREFLKKMLGEKILDLSPLTEPQALNLVKHLSRFEEVVRKSYLYLDPSIIVQYTNSLCYFARTATDALELNEKTQILRVNKARLVLFYATQIILHKCLKLLSITPLDKFK